MKFAGIENEKGTDENADASRIEDAACGPECNCGSPEIKAEPETACGPGCCCNSSSSLSGKKLKTLVFVLVLLAMVGVFIYKNNTRKNNSNNQAAPNSPAFAVAAAGSSVKAKATPVTAKTETATATAVVKSNEAAPEADGSNRKIGAYLDSLSSLNKVALSQDAVFIFIPAAKNGIADEATGKAVNAAQKTLKGKNINLGLYTLPTSSTDYPAIAARVQAPAILVVCKGRGMTAVSGEVTETKLLQAFMASSRSGGCCGSSGCGPSSSGCN